MPQPSDAHNKLHRLAGEWAGEEKLSPSPWGPGGPANGRINIRVDLDGFWLLQDYVEEKDGRITYRGHGVFGYDEKKKKYVWYWVDSMGMVPPSPSYGTWTGDTLLFESKAEQGLGRYTYKFLDENSYFFKIENSFDGGKTWTQFIEATYRRA